MKHAILKSIGNAQWFLGLNRYLYVLKETSNEAKNTFLKIDKFIEFESPVKYTLLKDQQLVGVTHENEKVIKFFRLKDILDNETQEIDLTKLEPQYQYKNQKKITCLTDVD